MCLPKHVSRLSFVVGCSYLRACELLLMTMVFSWLVFVWPDFYSKLLQFLLEPQNIWALINLELKLTLQNWSVSKTQVDLDIEPKIDGLDFKKYLISILEALSNQWLTSQLSQRMVIFTLNMLMGIFAQWCWNLRSQFKVGFAATHSSPPAIFVFPNEVLISFIIGSKHIHNRCLAMAKTTEPLVGLLHPLAYFGLKILKRLVGGNIYKHTLFFVANPCSFDPEILLRDSSGDVLFTKRSILILPKLQFLIGSVSGEASGSSSGLVFCTHELWMLGVPKLIICICMAHTIIN